MKCVVGRCDLASVYEQMLIFVKLQLSLAGFNNSLGHTRIQQTWSRWRGNCCTHKDWLNYLTVGMAMAHGRKWLLLLPSWARLMDQSECMNMIKEHENKSKTGRTVYWVQGENRKADKQISRRDGADATMNKWGQDWISSWWFFSSTCDSKLRNLISFLKKQKQQKIF